MLYLHVQRTVSDVGPEYGDEGGRFKIEDTTKNGEDRKITLDPDTPRPQATQRKTRPEPQRPPPPRHVPPTVLAARDQGIRGPQNPLSRSEAHAYQVVGTQRCRRDRIAGADGTQEAEHHRAVHQEEQEADDGRGAADRRHHDKASTEERAATGRKAGGLSIPDHRPLGDHDLGHQRPASPLAAFAAQQRSHRTHRPGGPAVKVLVERTEPEELRNQSAVVVASRLHPRGNLEPVHKVGEQAPSTTGTTSLT